MNSQNITTGPTGEDTPRPVLTIIHTAERGTVLDGLSTPDTDPGGQVRAVLDAQASTWRPHPGWCQRHSHDRPARTGRIHDTANRLRALGYEVDVWIDETPCGQWPSSKPCANRPSALPGRNRGA
jgi:hypothetical protein